MSAERPAATIPGRDLLLSCMSERRASDAAIASRFVVFEETGEEREVKTWCLRCQADSDFTILSPTGKAHYSSDTGDDTTRCGIDATGDDWWHRL